MTHADLLTRLGPRYQAAPGDRIVRRHADGIVVERADGTRRLVVETEPFLSRCGDMPQGAGKRWAREVGGE